MRLERLEVAGFTYRVMYKPIEARGLCDPQAQTITLHPDLSSDQQGEILLHEIFHAVEDAAGLNLSEAVIRAFGRGFWAVLKQTSELLAILQTLAVTQPPALERARVSDRQSARAAGVKAARGKGKHGK